MERERKASSSRGEILKGDIVIVYSNPYILYFILFYFWDDEEVHDSLFLFS